MTWIPSYALLCLEVVWDVLFWALWFSIIATILTTILLVAVVSTARLLQWRTMKHLWRLPGRREVVPFLNQWIMIKACTNSESPVGSGTLLFNAILGSQARFKKHGMHLQYNGFYPLLCVYRADFVQAILTSKEILTKGRQYNFYHDWLGTGLITSTGNKWKTRRRMFNPIFHSRLSDDFAPNINAQSMLLADIIAQESLKSGSCDVVPKVAVFTVDIVCETILGMPLNALRNSGSSYIEAANRLGDHLFQRPLNPLCWSDIIYRNSKSGKDYNDCLNTIQSFTNKVISKRKEALKIMMDGGTRTFSSGTSTEGAKSKKTGPLPDVLLLEHLKNAKTMSEEDIREEVATFMFAGSDTTAMSISWALFLIGHSPTAQQKIHDELDAIFGEDTQRHVNHKDLKEMKYLECAIKESQRIYPPIPFITRMCDEPFQLAGVTIPKGTTLQIAIYFLHRDESVFPKPEEFHPERFFPENSQAWHPFAFVPFSAGIRNCIGQQLAKSEVKIVIANILRRFKIKSIDQRDQVELTMGMVLRPKSGLRIKFIPRNVL